ncbi:MAG: S41 family peptidase [Myxococcota bacterium]
MNSKQNPAKRRPRAPLLHGALALAAAAVLASLPGPAAATELSCDRIPDLMRQFLQKHYQFNTPNDELRARVVDTFLRRLDPGKTLYLRDEATALEKRLQGVLLDVSEGNCAVLRELHEDVPRRYAAMERYIERAVSRDDYAIDPNVTLVIDPEKRARPATVEERNALYDRLIDFQMANYAVALAAESGALADGAKADGAKADGAKDEAADASHATIEVTPELLEKARQRLLKRQALQTKRAKETKLEDMYASFLDSFARALDPHSNYLSQDVFDDFTIQMQLSLEGIGVSLTYKDGYSVVDRVIPGGATAKQKALEPGDKIIAVAQEDGEFVDVVDMDLRDVVRLIRGPRDTTVRLGVLRDENARLNVAIVRERIDLEESAASLRVEEIERGDKKLRLGFVDLPSFYGDHNPAKRQSSRDMRKLLKEAKQENLDGLVLDLSRNGGGLLENAVEIAGLFVADGGVVAVKDTYGKLQVMHDPDDAIAWDGPLVVLTSRFSASASEIVAGAMKDYHRALLVGDDHTFGKGTVQSMVRQPPGLGAIKVTTALFFRPGGVSTQHEGVASDLTLPAEYDVDEFGEKHQPYSLATQQVAPFVEAHSAGGESAPWPPLTTDLVGELAQRSAERVKATAEFQEYEREVAEARARGGIVAVRDILSRSMPTEDATPEEPEDGEEHELTAHQHEALEILADYVTLGGHALADNRLSSANAPN